MHENNITTVNTNGKMKLSGYICLGVAFILSILKLTIPENGIGMDIIEHWTNTGLFLLFGNAVKHNVSNGINAMHNKKDGVR